MKKKGESHLPAPLAGCPCPDGGPIPTAQPKTSMVTNQYICIFESHSSPYLFQEFICSHSSVPKFTPSYNEIVTSIWVISAREAYCRNRQQKLTRCRPDNSAVKTGSMWATQFGNENWFAAACTIWQQNLFHCWCHNFSSECYFVAATTFSAANANLLHLLQKTQFRQRVINSLPTTQLRQRITISL
jgi:hypothetical protein